MQQRRPRLGDVVDDYCPRERRITNHVIVAMIEDEVKQTRCSTCDADHEYKQARVPPQRKKKEPAALDRPLSDDAHARMVSPDAASELPDEDTEEIAESVSETTLAASEDAETMSLEAGAEGEGDADASAEDEGPVHRRLIRATLPRPEGQVPERKLPDFTVRQQGRGSRFEHNTDGNKPPRHQRRARGHQQASGGGQPRFGGQRQGGGGGQGQNGNRPGAPGSSRPGGRHGVGQGRKRGR